LKRFFGSHQGDVFIGGHTHIPMLRQYEGKLIVNPGSVGSAFRSVFHPGTLPTVMPWAEYAVMEVGNGIISVDLRRIPFDVNEFNQIVSQSGIPIS
jgi:predicted phosphodiesterase